MRRFELVEAKDGGKLTVYSHAGGRMAVVVDITGNVSEDVARDIAMQITAMSPKYLDKSEVDTTEIEKEKEIERAQLKEQGKPDEMIEKILVGKMEKYASEISLLQQVYVKDSGGKKKVGQYLKEVDPNSTVLQFVRYEVGEGLEKKKDDFADEVAKMVS